MQHPPDRPDAAPDRDPSPLPPGGKRWRVGSLVYNKAQLFSVFFWMLWGDFCLHLMDYGVIPNLVPLQLRDLGASSALIGLLTGSVLSAMNFALVPVISTASDRHRGRLGRRMPFMLFATPPLALCLIALGFSTNLAGFLQTAMPWLLGGYTTAAVTIGVIGVLLVAYKFFDLFPQSVYYYLWTDVVPQELMGTFACLFRVAAYAGSFVFNKFLLRYTDTHATEIYVGSAVLYLVAFLLLVFMVREGTYPPPEPVTDRAGARGMRGRLAALGATARMYVRDCFSLGYYWKYFLMNACFMWGFIPFNTFLILYGTDPDRGLGLDRGAYGDVMAIRDGVRMGLFLLLGPVIDRFHPLRAGLFGYVLMSGVALGSFFLIDGSTTFAVFGIATFVAVAVFQGATGALGPRLLPREKYGQFCSAASMVSQLGLIAAGGLCGLFLDLTGSFAFIFVWLFAFTAAGVILMALLYREWKQLGGDEDYVAPLPRAREQEPEVPAGFEVVPVMK